MTDIRYYRDSIRNYMVLACGEEEDGRGYQYRMLAANRIPGLLACSLRYIDDRRLLYYDISSRQKLTALDGARSLEGSHYRHLLEKAAETTDRLSEYLLDASCLLLDPDYIYVDLTDMEFYFAYDPAAEEGTLPLLTAFLTERLGPDEKDLTAAVWELDVLARDPDFSLRRKTLEKLLPAEPSPGPAREERAGERPVPPEEEPFPEEDLSDGEEKEPADPKGKRLQILFPLLLLLAGAALLALFFSGALAGRALRLSFAGGLSLLLAGALLGVRQILPGIPSILRKKKEKKKEKAAETDFWEEDAEEDLAGPVPVPVEETGPEDALPVLPGSRQTRVLGGAAPEKLRLYGEDRARGLHIDLDRLPCTVGSSPDFADAVLEDPAVSRLHARIWKSGDGVLQIKDLGSTNGTWINGVRLGPEESAGLLRGDIVSFGGLEFHCR